MHAERANHDISMLCRALGFSRSGYHKWADAKPSERQIENKRLAAEIRAIHGGSKERYGSPRIHAELVARGKRVGRKRVARLMSEGGIRARPKRRFRKTTDSSHALPVAHNILARAFSAEAPNRAWAGDITYIWTLQGWLYLAVLIDLYSRRVVGWSTSTRLTRDLALGALQMAIARRQPPPGCLHHSDRGSQYASHEYRSELKRYGLVCSMSRKGNCWDNAVSESFFATLEKELLDDAAFGSIEAAETALSEYIEVFYNRQRRHSVIGYMTPVQFELVNSTQFAA